MRRHPLFLLLVLLVLGLSAIGLRFVSPERTGDVEHFNLTGIRTWRLEGWRERGGKRVPWNIYCQTTPLYYSEQLGDDRIVLTEDGTLAYFGPTPTTPPVAVLTLSRTRAPSLDLFANGAAPERDPTTQLPARFVWTRFARISGELAATYNQPLPPAARALDVPKTTLQVNLVGLPTVPPRSATRVRNGISVQGEAHVDPTGLVRVELRYWLGDVPVTPDLPLDVGAFLPGRRQERSPTRQSIADNTGNGFVLLESGLGPPRSPQTRGKLQSLVSDAIVSGTPFPKRAYLVPIGPVRASATTLRLPLDLSVQLRHPSPPRSRSGLGPTVHVELTVPLRRDTLPLTDPTLDPLPILRQETLGSQLLSHGYAPEFQARGTAALQTAQRLRQRWQPRTPEQRRANAQALQQLQAWLAPPEETTTGEPLATAR